MPSLSQIRGWETDHLSQAASAWTNTADDWEDSFNSISRQMGAPGGISWSGDAADAARSRALLDRQRAQGFSDSLRVAASVARAAAGDIQAAKRAALCVIGEAHAEGFVVGERLSLTDQFSSAPAAELSARQMQAQALAAEIHVKAAALAAVDRQAAERIGAAASGLSAGSFDTVDAPHSPATVQTVDFHGAPFPAKPSWTTPDPPPGGWSNDPVTRAAQKIAYGHASAKHLASEWPPGTTREQLASEVERIMRAGTDPRGGMIVGRTRDGAPAIYDPKTNTLVIRDPGAADAGTVYRPDKGEPYARGRIRTTMPSLSPNELGDAPVRPRFEPPRAEPQSPGVLPRAGFPPIVGVPPLIGSPGLGEGDLPIVDVDGPPDVGFPGLGR